MRSLGSVSRLPSINCTALLSPLLFARGHDTRLICKQGGRRYCCTALVRHIYYPAPLPKTDGEAETADPPILGHRCTNFNPNRRANSRVARQKRQCYFTAKAGVAAQKSASFLPYSRHADF